MNIEKQYVYVLTNNTYLRTLNIKALYYRI